LLLSLVGGAVDFASASLFLMGGSRFSTWSLGLFAFGGIIIVTGIIGITSLGIRRMEILGGLMFAYGEIMLAIGWLMYPIPMIFGATLSSVGMFIVGASMVASGFFMSLRKGMGMNGMQSQGSVRPTIFIASLVVVGLLGFGIGSIYNQSATGQNGMTTTMTGNRQSGSSMSEELSLTRFDFTNLTLVKLTITNTGSSPLTITRISFNGTDVTPNSYLSCIVSLASSSNVPLTTAMGGQTQCRLSFPVFGVSAGTDYPIRIVTASGTQFVFFVTAGGTTVGM